MTRTTCLVVVLLISIAQIAGAQATLHVPATYPTIQAGIDNAVTGDTVLVAPGTYHENLIIQNKEIRLVGNGGAQVTIIDGGQLGTVLTIKEGLGRALLIKGFTIRNGRGADGYGHGFAAKPGGVLVLCSSPTFLECRIKNNFGGNAYDRAMGGPGGVALKGCGPDIDGAAFIRCNVRANVGGTTMPVQTPFGTYMGGQGGTGGLLLVEANMFMHASFVEDNVGGDSYDSTLVQGAGGIEIVVPRLQTKIDDSLICWNAAGDAGDGTLMAGAGGIHGGSPEILFCVVDHNIGGDVIGATGVMSSGAGGIYGVAPKVLNTFVRHNLAGHANMAGTQGAGGGIYVTGDALISSSVVTDNVGGDDLVNPGFGGGGGIHALSGNPMVVQSTVANNLGGNGNVACGCGGVHTDAGTLTVVNSILWDDQGGSNPVPAPNEAGGPGAVTVLYTDVDGGFTGLGNMNVDPLFVNAASDDYHLAALSPVMDMALPFSPLFPTKDIDAEPRVIGPAVDMGADEFNQGIYPGTGEDLVLESIINFWGDPLGSAKYLRAGDHLEISVISPLGTFAPPTFWLVASPFPTGSPPAPIPGLPGFQLGPVGFFVLAPGPFPISDISWPNGRTWVFNNAISYPGWSLMVQGFALDGTAANGWFAATDGLELRFD